MYSVFFNIYTFLTIFWCFFIHLKTFTMTKTKKTCFYCTGEFTKRVREMLSQLFSTLYTLSNYSSAHTAEYISRTPAVKFCNRTFSFWAMYFSSSMIFSVGTKRFQKWNNKSHLLIIIIIKTKGNMMNNFSKQSIENQLPKYISVLFWTDHFIVTKRNLY